MIVHKDKGLNPRMGMCPRCGEDNGEIIMLGTHDKKGTCNQCGATVYGLGIGSNKCPKCGSKKGYRDVSIIGEYEKIPASICPKCNDELKTFADIVESGGVYWRCSKCNANGAIRPNEFTKQVREDAGIPAPKPMGIILNEQCPICNKEGNPHEN